MIHMMSVYVVVALLSYTALSVSSSDGALQRPKKPHIIVLALDDIGWADVGYHGSNFPTPHIDALVKEGVELDRMYAMPQCSPTRSAIITGRWAWNTGLQHYTTIMPGATAGIPTDVPTVAEIMREAGYATHMIGKWHLGSASKQQNPVNRGFDSYLGYLQGETDYYARTLASCADPICLFRGNCLAKMHGFACSKPMNSTYGPNAAGEDFWDGEQLAVEDFGKYTQGSYMRRFKSLLENYNASKHDLSGGGSPKPMFLYFASQLLHIPLQLPDSPHHLERCRNVRGGTEGTNRTVLCAMASQLDESVGQIVQWLHDYGMYDNTVIWAYSDNGGMTQWGKTFPASASSNFPLRGSKTTVFEGGVRSVAWVVGGALPTSARGTKVKALLHAVDILPTVVGLAGLDASKLPSGLNGEDVWDTIVGGHALKRTELPLQIAMNRDLNVFAIPQFWRRDRNVANFTALIRWPYKLILGSPYIPTGQAEDRSRAGWWDVHEYAYTPPPAHEAPVESALLFNLETDETENHNLAAQFPDIVAMMKKRVYDWWLNEKSGYVRPQLNMPRPQANPRFHNWTWAPFHHLIDERKEELLV